MTTAEVNSVIASLDQIATVTGNNSLTEILKVANKYNLEPEMRDIMIAQIREDIAKAAGDAIKQMEGVLKDDKLKEKLKREVAGDDCKDDTVHVEEG